MSCQHTTSRARVRAYRGHPAGDIYAGPHGHVIFRIDDGDYRYRVDAARTKIETPQATIAASAARSPAGKRAEQAKAQLAPPRPACEAGRLDFDRQQE